MKVQAQALVCGAGGFIGTHLVKKLKREGFWVRGADLKFPSFLETEADDFVIGDLREKETAQNILDREFDEVYQLAADMGGAGFVFTGENDSGILSNSALINLNIVKECRERNVKKLFFSSSACVYPERNQTCPSKINTKENSVYPANPDSEYGWEKLFSEHIYLAFRKNYGLNTKIARFHNIFGPEGPWNDGREKAPAAICRKVAEAEEGGGIEVWGGGEQLRSFLFVDECLEGVRRLMDSENFHGPVNIGSDEMISINGLAEMVMHISGKTLRIKHVPGPSGVNSRNSDNRLIEEKLGWSPDYPLRKGMEITYRWIESQISKQRQS